MQIKNQEEQYPKVMHQVVVNLMVKKLINLQQLRKLLKMPNKLKKKMKIRQKKPLLRKRKVSLNGI